MIHKNLRKKKLPTIEERVTGLERALSYYVQKIDDIEKKCKCQWHPMQCNGKVKAFFKRLLGL